MLTKEKIERINALAKKSKLQTLTAEEKTEQKSLRDEYLKNFRKSFINQLETIRFVEDDNNECPVENNKEKK